MRSWLSFRPNLSEASSGAAGNFPVASSFVKQKLFLKTPGFREHHLRLPVVPNAARHFTT
jgi:hypothetical protein